MSRGPSGGPLAGIRVVELAGLGPAPYACLLLAEWGAEVIRIDRVDESNPLQALPVGLGRSRRSLAVDPKAAAGVAVVARLLERADVLVEGWRPGVAERLGLGPEVCLERNPRLVYARMTGWGQDGPLAQAVGHDITYAALSGALHAIGPASRPIPPLNLVADFGGGSMFLVSGILAALVSRASSGEGQVVDAAMVEGAASLMTMPYALHSAGVWADERESNLLDGAAPFYRTYECSDGKFVAVGALEPGFYAALLAGLGLDLAGAQHDRASWPNHAAAMATVFRTRPRDEWAAHFADTDACVAPVLSLAEAPHHPHNVARGCFLHTDSGAALPKVPPRFSQTPTRAPGPESHPGAHTLEVLREAGWGDDELEQLQACGAIRQAADQGTTKEQS